MFVDNYSSHPQWFRLSNIKFIYLPANTTSISQPLDGGVIKNFKGNYRRLMVKRLLALINSGEKIDSKGISLLDTVLMIQSASNYVKQTKIMDKRNHNQSNQCVAFEEESHTQISQI